MLCKLVCLQIPIYISQNFVRKFIYRCELDVVENHYILYAKIRKEKSISFSRYSLHPFPKTQIDPMRHLQSLSKLDRKDTNEQLIVISIEIVLQP